ncbi:MBL fold metallo-hydrolase [Vibrio mangrovi]|uniref:MBL fold metallo-hydrolase n=1 Tax=Vibrio mangrovi TaxID=474394 RepID=A0A1Y6IV55_9VIBR|nr:MBL fold metallo-hydrolase [Vibrio mangrovi]MDW6003288.1 MBL fold metallo-hydrolase [Vibrio mangrovi]SMR99923.1 metal-dependent hydrolase [Vibrio mangrovi]
MRNFRCSRTLFSSLSLSVLALFGCSASGQDIHTSPSEFANTEVQYQPGFSTYVTAFWNMLTSDVADLTPAAPIPLMPMTSQQLAHEDKDVIYRLGHSTVLMKLGKQWILTDPMFSQHASPVQWMGPERFHPAPIAIKDLPEIDMVLISHNHFDHLDEDSIVRLAPKVKQFLVPAQIGKILTDWGVAENKIQALNWWNTTQVGETQLIFTPSQHYSGRGMTDQNETLWGGWVILAPTHRIYFSGDSGYFHGFKQIGDQYGPFDVALLEDGQYNHSWPAIHLFPDEVVQATLDLKSKVVLPVHNSTFKLANHSWNEPLEQVYQISQQRGVTMVAPEFGQRYEIGQPLPVRRWWAQ